MSLSNNIPDPKRIAQIKDLVKRYEKICFEKEDCDDISESFMEWLEHETESCEKLDALNQIWENGSDAKLQPRDRKQVAQIIRRAGYDRKEAILRPRLGSILIRIAAVLIPAMVLGGIWLVQNNKPHVDFQAEYIVPKGTTKNYNLPDSSQLMVNANSKLNIIQSDKSRVAELSGEAYFKIARDEKRPFTVQTTDITITVLGTKFDVEAYPNGDQTIVTLEQGKVSLVTPDGKLWKLESSQQFVYDRITMQGEIHTLTNTNSTLSWMSGAITCEYKTLVNIFYYLERKFAVDFKVDTGVDLDKGMTYTINFDPETSLETVLEGLKELTGKFEYNIDGDTVWISDQK